MNDFAYDVFLSFAAADRLNAEKLWRQLSANRLRVFWAEAEIRVGELWLRNLQVALEQSRHMALLCSTQSLQSGWVEREYQTFLALTIPAPERKLVPILIDGTAVDNLPALLRPIQCCRLSDRDLIQNLVSKFRDDGGDPPFPLTVLTEVQSTLFPNITSLYNYVSDRILSARSSIDDITWGTQTDYPSVVDARAYERYVLAVESAAGKDEITYREISNFAEMKYVERTRSLLRFYGYKVRYIDTRLSKVPLLSFVIIDGTEVISAFYRRPFRQDRGEIYLAAQFPDMVRLLQDYFDTLWAAATVIKDGTTDEMALDAIANQLNSAPHRIAGEQLT